MSLTGSTTSGATGTVTKVNVPAATIDRIVKIRDVVKEYLPRFPLLQGGPDVLYWIMATFGAESGWKVLHGKTNPSSRHFTPALPKDSQLSRVGYELCDVIQNIRRDPAKATNLSIIEAIKDGYYAHGISACMGSYHVRGCKNNTQEFRVNDPGDLISELGLEVDPGVSITQTLFPDEGDLSIRRSVAAGMIIFNSKYTTGLRVRSGDTAAAMQYALGAYLGKAGARDANRVSPEDRRIDLNTNVGRANLLKIAEIARTGDKGQVLDNYRIVLADQSAKASGSTSVSNNPGTFVATTNSNSNGQSAKTPGCELS